MRAYLEDLDLPVDEGPPDDGSGAPRPSHNFAPGYNGLVYRAQVGDRGYGPDSSFAPRHAREVVSHDEPVDDENGHNVSEVLANGTTSTEQDKSTFELTCMRWGLIPSWTRRNPDYGSMLKTINCRDDSLAQNTGMWTGIKGRKRCVVLAKGFYEWLKKAGPTSRSCEKVPHFVRYREDGRLMMFAGLWDCARFESGQHGNDDTPGIDTVAEKRYTYTIITTDSSKQLNFLHDRMPVILRTAEDVRLWLDPQRWHWDGDLQKLCRPLEEEELLCYPVSQEVGKVGNDSAEFMVPVGSKESKRSIEGFFARSAAAKGRPGSVKKEEDELHLKLEDARIKLEHSPEGSDTEIITEHNHSETNAPLPIPKTELNKNESGFSDSKRIKHSRSNSPEPSAKRLKTSPSQTVAGTEELKKQQQRESSTSLTHTTRSATSNRKTRPISTSPIKTLGKDRKITSFFSK